MLKPNTVFVLGAAFSAEMDFPLGGGLKAQIRDLLSRSGRYRDNALLDLIESHPEYGRAADQLRAALPLAASIDNLVEHKSRDEAFVTVAKWSIARAIAIREAKSPLGPRPESQSPKPLPTGNSYEALFQLVVQGARTERLEQAFSRLKVITFNYDRTLEVYLHRAIRAYSDVNQSRATEILNQAAIIHAYGALGASDEGFTRPTRFAGDEDPARIAADARGLRTFSEKSDSRSVLPIHDQLITAERLVVLGCAFHPQNLRLIEPEIHQLTEVYATAYAAPPDDPAGKASPAFERYSLAQGQVLRDALVRWPLHEALRGGGHQIEFEIEAMTCRQLIGMHGARWLG